MDTIKAIKLGMIGTGRIARRFVPECACVEGIRLVAVFNPHEGSAKRFVDGLWEKQTDGCHELMATDDLEHFLEEVEAVYIASPHETHFGYIKKALSKGKHVLCEKPMALSVSEADAVFRLAEENGLVLMEGLKTAYFPGYRKLLDVVASGVAGEAKYIESCFTKLENTAARELVDTKFGGSFLELGSYVALPILDLFGSGYTEIRFSKIANPLGLDLLTKLDLTYEGRFASALCGLGVKAEGSLLIAGTEGYIRVEAPWWKTTHFEVHFEDPAKVIAYDEAFEGDGLRYEIKEFIKRIKANCPYGENSMERCRSLYLSDLMERFSLACA